MKSPKREDGSARLPLKNAAKEGTKAAHGPAFPRIGYIETLEAAKNSDHYKAPLGKLQGRGVASGFWFNAGGNLGASQHHRGRQCRRHHGASRHRRFACRHRQHLR